MIVNMNGGLTGATLTVTAPAGCTVTVSKDGKVKTKVADASGAAVFKGLATGQWTLAISDGTQTAQKTVEITADYSAEITFFSATINVTYPAGSVCTATDGVTTLTAPDTSGTWDCVVPNAGTWTVVAGSYFSETVEITENGETQTVRYKYYLFRSGYGLQNDVTLNIINGCTGYNSSDKSKMTMNYNGHNVFSFSPSVDLSVYKSVVFDIQNLKNTNYATVCGVSSNATSWSATDGNLSNYFDAYTATGGYTTDRTTLILDISSMSGEKYVKVHSVLNSCDVYNIYLEM